MNIKVSIVIPTFGRPENLLRAISSVMRQTYNNLEIIVVDDNGKGSENQIKTEELLNDEKYKDIIYIVLPNNKGGGIARNYGIEKASGEVITFLDDDDYYLCNKVEV
ncbi:glycosyltransferase family 2 protein, partial [Escherichia coli]